ncbi:MAG TPA: ester cyclase [Acidimicrobiales bacterium]|nr:ester cyclase [Acidimicrobiales bacterium]
MGGSPADVVRSFWQSVWTEGQSEKLLDLFAADATENAEPVDIEQFRRAVDSWRGIFPDFSATVEEMFDLGEGRVVTRVTYRGTQTKPWAGLPVSGNTYAGVGIDIFTVRDGRITELWHAADHYDMAVQLGGKIAPAD